MCDLLYRKRCLALCLAGDDSMTHQWRGLHFRPAGLQ